MRPPAALLTLGLALLGGFAPAAAAPGGSPASDRVRFVYRFSEKPAAGLAASLTDARTGSTTRVFLGEDGSLPLPRSEASLRLTDLDSGLTLFAANPLSRPADGVIRVPLPVRVAGRLAGFDPDPTAVEIHVGSGPRVPVSDYQRAEHGARFQPFPEENRAWGLDLPLIASRWEVRRPAPGGLFETGWIAVSGPPQLAVMDRSGRIATLEVPLPANVQPRATLQAGEIAPQESASLEIDRSGLPATDLPLALAAGIEKVTARAGGETAALRLALLSRVAPEVARFAMQRGEIPLELEGATHVTGLPPFSSLVLYATGPLPGLLVKRSVEPTGNGTARISLAGLELLGERRTLPLSGVVRLAGGEPLAGAKVVYSSYPDRFETRTDPKGAFRIPRALAGRSAVLFVDAQVPGGKPPFDRFTVSDRFEIPPGETAVERVIEIPRPLANQTEDDIRSCPGGLPGDPTNPISYRFEACGSSYTQDDLQLAFCPVLAAWKKVNLVQELYPVEVQEIRIQPDGALAEALVSFPSTGEYTLILSYTPFVYAQAIAVVDRLDPLLVQFRPPTPWTSTVISAADPSGRPVPDLEISFPNWVEPADPYEALTGSLGTLRIDCFNLDPVPAFVDDPRGCFEGAVRLRERGVNVQLESCEGF